MRAADEDGFRTFVAGRSIALLQTAYLLTGDRGTAADLLRFALVRTYRRWPHLDDPDSCACELIVGRYLGHLPGRTRRRTAALVLRYWAGRPVLEIAQLLDCSVGTVCTLTQLPAAGKLQLRAGYAERSAAVGAPVILDPAAVPGSRRTLAAVLAAAVAVGGIAFGLHQWGDPRGGITPVPTRPAPIRLVAAPMAPVDGPVRASLLAYLHRPATTAAYAGSATPLVGSGQAYLVGGSDRWGWQSGFVVAQGRPSAWRVLDVMTDGSDRTSEHRVGGVFGRAQTRPQVAYDFFTGPVGSAVRIVGPGGLHLAASMRDGGVGVIQLGQPAPGHHLSYRIVDRHGTTVVAGRF